MFFSHSKRFLVLDCVIPDAILSLVISVADKGDAVTCGVFPPCALTVRKSINHTIIEPKKKKGVA